MHPCMYMCMYIVRVCCLRVCTIHVHLHILYMYMYISRGILSVNAAGNTIKPWKVCVDRRIKARPCLGLGPSLYYMYMCLCPGGGDYSRGERLSQCQCWWSGRTQTWLLWQPREEAAASTGHSSYMYMYIVRVHCT